MLNPLLVTSCYSFHFGTAFPAELARRARELGYPSLALTDRGGVYGIPAFLEACAEEGIAPLLGTELAYGNSRAVLIARTSKGWSRICRLLTDRARGGFDAPSALRAEAARSPCALGVGVAPDLFIASDDVTLLRESGGRMYALLSSAIPSGSRGPLWRALLETGAPPLATGEVRYLTEEDRSLQRLLVAIGSSRTVADVRETELSPRRAVFAPPSEAAQLYEEIPEAVSANEALTDSVELSGLFGGWVFPRYPADRYPEHPAGNASERDSSTLLRDLVREGALARYGTVEGKVRERMEYELGIIERKGFSDYFLVVRDITRKTERTCGRGSAAASLVSYVLGITDVDPLAHGLYFDRFLNPGREDPPDIDVDFAWDERDAILNSVIGEYGENRAARVANHVYFQTRSALRETARAYGMPEGEISDMERALAVDREAAAAGADSEWREILDRAPRIVGFPRHLGVHSGGLIVTPDDLTDRVPVEKSGSGIRIVSWDKEGVEAAGLVKIDLLGNRSLAVVRDALANLRENGTRFDEGTWNPLSDPDTVRLLARGDTLGVFYVESPAMRILQKKTGRGDFEHLVIHSSIIRPAANRYINEYIDRLNGKPFKPLHPLLDGLLSETYGILCYQEDVSKAAVALAGFTPAEADGVRKILSKKDVRARLSTWRGKFEAGARERGVDDETVRTVWEMIESFAGYSFVKAHSASYAKLSFRSAYLRAHHPAEFMAAVLSNRGGFYSTLAYASEARRMGITLLPPDVNASEVRCRGREGSVRFGLDMIASLGTELASQIVDERRRNGPYGSVEDFGRRVRVHRTAAESLAGSGALDGLDGGKSRAERLFRLFSLTASKEEPFPSAGALFPEETSTPIGRERVGNRVRESPRRRCEAQMRYLGTTLDVHPLALYPGLLARPRNLGKDLPALAGRRVELVGWPITAKPVLTAEREPMMFVSFEDETALYETVLFPKVYARFRPLLYENGPLLIRGTAEFDRGVVVLNVESLGRIA